LGLPEYIEIFLRFIDKDKNQGYRMLNNFCINYVKIDLDNRLKLCKQNTKLYEDLKDAVIDKIIVDNSSKSKQRLCYNCGKYITDDEMLKITNNGFEGVVYAHTDCLKD